MKTTAGRFRGFPDSCPLFLCMEKAMEQSSLFGMEIYTELRYNFKARVYGK
jgi:hypothetical protein